MTFISRDPFAREEVHSEKVYTSETCTFCGCTKIEKRSGKHYLYQYRVETDEGWSYYARHLFCSRSCQKAFNN